MSIHCRLGSRCIPLIGTNAIKPKNLVTALNNLWHDYVNGSSKMPTLDLEVSINALHLIVDLDDFDPYNIKRVTPNPAKKFIQQR